MKLTVDRDVFTENVTWTARTVPARPAVPVLAGVFLTAKDGTLTLSSFDYEVSSTGTVPADVEVEGSVLIPGRFISNVAKMLPHAPVTMELEDNNVVVTCASSRFRMPVMAADDYPSLPSMPELSGTIAASDFTRAVNQSVIAASREDNLPLLNSVKVESEGSTLRFIATDRYRLVTTEIPWTPVSDEVSISALFKGKTLSDVSKSLTSAGEINLHLGTDGRAGIGGFTAGGRTTTSQLNDGEYPKVLQLFPTTSTITVTVGREELLAAVRRVGLVIHHTSPIIMSCADGHITLRGGAVDEAQASETITAHLDGEPIDVGFSPAYLIDCLNVVPQPYVQIALTSVSKPSIIKGVESIGAEADGSFRYLIMPRRFGV